MKAETRNPTKQAARRSLHNEELLKQELEYLWDEPGTSGKSYTIYLGKISRSPIVRSQITGKYFALPWPKIVELAVKGGVDERTPGRMETHSKRPV